MSIAAPPRVTTAGPDRPDQALPEFGSGGGDWSLLVVAPNRVVAHLIGGLLTHVGIEFVLDTFNPSPGAWLLPFGDPAAPVKIMVRRFDLSAGRAIIDTTQSFNRERAMPPLAGRREPRTWNPRLVLVVTFTIVLLLTVVEVVGFAPCFLRLFCF